jgi:hypothetical protein
MDGIGADRRKSSHGAAVGAACVMVRDTTKRDAVVPGVSAETGRALLARAVA